MMGWMVVPCPVVAPPGWSGRLSLTSVALYADNNHIVAVRVAPPGSRRTGGLRCSIGASGDGSRSCLHLRRPVRFRRDSR